MGLPARVRPGYLYKQELGGSSASSSENERAPEYKGRSVKELHARMRKGARTLGQISVVSKDFKREGEDLLWDHSKEALGLGEAEMGPLKLASFEIKQFEKPAAKKKVHADNIEKKKKRERPFSSSGIGRRASSSSSSSSKDAVSKGAVSQPALSIEKL